MSNAVATSPAPAPKLTLAEALSSARETRALVVGSGVLCEVGRVFAEQFPGSRAVVVADEQTFALAGRAVAESFAAAGVSCIHPFIFRHPALYAEFSFVEELEISLRQHEAVPA